MLAFEKRATLQSSDLPQCFAPGVPKLRQCSRFGECSELVVAHFAAIGKIFERSELFAFSLPLDPLPHFLPQTRHVLQPQTKRRTEGG